METLPTNAPSTSDESNNMALYNGIQLNASFDQSTKAFSLPTFIISMTNAATSTTVVMMPGKNNVINNGKISADACLPVANININTQEITNTNDSKPNKSEQAQDVITSAGVAEPNPNGIPNASIVDTK